MAFELVLPNGTVATVTEENHDLWFALRVTGRGISYWDPFAKIHCRVVGITSLVAQGSLTFGGLNYPQGIVTKFTVKSHVQGQVWVSTLDELRKATLPMIFIWDRVVLLYMDQTSWKQ